MPYFLLEHTADVRMRVTGRTMDGLFRDALLGMVAVMAPDGRITKPVLRTIALQAADPTALLIDFLSEALTCMHTEREAYTDVFFQTLTGQELKAELTGYIAGSFGEDIKAVTYHEAAVKKGESGAWETMIVFDV